MKTLLFLLFLLFFCSFAHSTEIIEGERKSIAQIIEVSGEALTQNHLLEKKGRWEPIVLGHGFPDGFTLKTLEKSYAKLLLEDNSIIKVSSQTVFQIIKTDEKKFEINLGRGKVRILSYQNPKTIKTPWGDALLEQGEFEWNVFNQNKKLKVSLTAYSGSIEMDGEKVLPNKYALLPEEQPENVTKFDQPYSFWFSREKDETGIDYDIAFQPQSLPAEKKRGRGIASVDEIEDVVVEEEVELEEFDKVKGDIWVHDIVYDEAVRSLERAAYEKARDLIPVAVKEASTNLVWDVASRSVLKWGVLYAKKTSERQIPISVTGSYLGEREDQFNFYDKNNYRKATEEIAELRSYRAAKVAVLKGGYEKGWREAQEYAEKMIPLVVKPIVMIQVQEYALPIGKKAVEEIITKSNLKKTEDVDKLLTHLSQVIAEKVTLNLIKEYSPFYTKMAAQVAAKEAARASAEEVAQYMAKDSGKQAGDLIIKILARERGRNIAREIASEAKRTEALDAKRKAEGWQIQSQR